MGEAIEERMMAEWAASRLAPGTYAMHVRLGPTPELPPGAPLTAQARALARITLPEADLVRRTDAGAEIVEFIIWRPHETLGQLLFYESLLPKTPGYEDLRADQVALRIVTGLEDGRFRAFAETQGIALEIYRPAWLEEALARRRGG